jgi:outer membrane protein assembly factor BamB
MTHRGTRLKRLVAGLALAGLLGGCGFWGSKKAPLPELPAVTGEAAMGVAWTRQIGPGGVGFQPLVVGDSVLVASRSGVVTRLDAATGNALWRVELGTPLIAGLGSDGETTVVAAKDGSLIALDRDGAQRWRTPVGAEIVTVPAVGVGLVVTRASDNRVTAWDLETGKRRWSFERQPPALVLRQTASIALDPGSAYVGLPGGRLVALSLQNGALRWEAAIGLPKGSNEIERIADVVGSPLISGREVCAAAWQGRVACLDTSTGRAGWGRELAAAAGIDLDASQLIAVDSEGAVHAFSRSGASFWKQEALKRRQPSAPLIAQSGLVVGDALGLVHRVSRDDGSLQARVATDGSRIVAAPVRWRNLAFVQTEAGALYALALD